MNKEKTATESQSQGSERLLILRSPSLAIKCELIDLNQKRKEKNNPIT